MPSDNFIVRHWQAELQIFHQNFLLLKEQMNPEPIHDLRVSVKKLRSYLKLYIVLFKKEDTEELFAKTKELFSVLGKHRNIEMSKQLLLSFADKNNPVVNSLFVYLQLLQDQISQYCQQVLQQYETTSLDELTSQLEQAFEGIGTEETANKVKDMILSSLQSIKHNLKHFKNKSHLVRKRLKDVLYWLKISPDDLVFTKSGIKTIDKILDHLGNVQDYEVLITNLKNFQKTILANSLVEYDLIKKIRNKAKKKKDILLRKANEITKELISKVPKKEKAT
jgi:CHAD domain-containing protein